MAEIERPAQAILQGLESGIELFDERAMPWIERNRWPVIAASAAVLVGVAAAIVVGRQRHRPTLAGRLHDATVSLGDRLEGPISTIKTTAERISR